MSCTNCTNNTTPFTIYSTQYVYKADCDSCSSSLCDPVDAKCTFYKAANLPCSTINTGDSLEVALQKIETKLCATLGDYSTYNINCLAPAGSILTEADFVDQMTAYACALSTTVTAFIDTTFPAYQSTVDARFLLIEVPSISCTSASVLVTDTIQQVLTKYCTKFDQIDTALSLATVTWDRCFTVVTPPTTIAAGLDLLADQICQVKTLATAGGLPSFNNVGSCLDTPGAADSLSSTIDKIKTRLCLTPTLDINSLSWSCVTKPSSNATDLQGALSSILSKLDTLSQNMVVFDSGDFSVSQTNPVDSCAGKTVALATSLNVDRFVAVNGADSTPGTLVDKLQAGSNITLDTLTTPGVMIISSTASGGDAFTVKASSTGAAGFLDAKVAAATTGAFTNTPSYDAGLDKIKIVPSYDIDMFFDEIMTYIENNADAKKRFCELVASCPSPCDAPTNVQAIVVP